MSDSMIVEAILRDNVSPGLMRLSRSQDEFSRRSLAMNVGANVMLGLGAAAVAFTVKSIKVAGAFDQIRRSMVATVGPQQAAFDTQYVDKFAQHSSKTYMDLYKAAGMLDRQHVSVAGHLKDMADIAAATGAPLSELAQIYDRLLAGGQTGRALGQTGFPRFGISTKEIFEAAGLNYKPGQKIYGAITPEQADAAIHKIIAQKGWGGLDNKMATTTLGGASSMVHDAVARLEQSIGDANLQPTIAALNHLAGAINSVADAAKNHPTAVKALEVGGAATLVGGGVMTGINVWQKLKGTLKDVTAIAAKERQGEADKIPIAGKEAAAVGKAAKAYGAAKDEVSDLATWHGRGVGAAGGFTKALTGTEKAADGFMHKGRLVDRLASMLMIRFPSASGVITKFGVSLAGAGTMAETAAGAFGVAALGITGIAAAAIGAAGDIYLVVKAIGELNHASRDQEAAAAAVRTAHKQGYDIDAGAGKAQGFAARSVWGQYWQSFRETFGAKREDPGFGALVGPQWFKQHHKMAPEGVRAHQIRKAAADAAKAAQAQREDAGEAADKYKLPAGLDYKLQYDQRHIDLLDAQCGSQAKINALKADEIKLHKQAEQLLRSQAKAALTPETKYRLLGEADSQAVEAARLAIKDKSKKDKGFDPLISKILGGASEDDLIKAGVNRRMFRSMGAGKLPKNPLTAALEQLKKRPMTINLHLDHKAIQSISVEVQDDVMHVIAQALASSGARPLMAGF